MQEIDKLGWLCVRDRRLLGARSKGRDAFFIPGGKREPGESDQQALVREIQEELSVALRPETLEPAGVFTAQADGKPEGTRVRLTCYFAESSGVLAAAAEIAEIAWLRHADRPRCSPAAQIILDWLRSDGRIE
jgi:8-oxo-dGTP diphosphatase